MACKSCQNSALNEDIQTAKLFSKQNLTDSASLSKLNESESTRPNPLSPESIAIEDLVSALSESDLEILNCVSRVPTEQISNTLGTKFQPENSLSKSTTEVKSKIELSSQQKEPTNLNAKRTKKEKDLTKERKERKRRGKSEAPGNKRNKKKKHDEVEEEEEEETKEQKIVQSSQNYEKVNDFHLNTQNNYQSSLENKLENTSKKQKLEKPGKNSKKSLKASKLIIKASKTSKSKAENGCDSIPVQAKSSPQCNSVLQIFKISRSPANKSNSSP